MRQSHAVPLLCIALIAGLALAVRAAAWPLAANYLPARAQARREPASAAVGRHPDSLVTVVVTRNPFRMTRRPAPISYDPLRLAQPAAPAVPKPTLALVGIVWGRGAPPTALLDGVPGAGAPRVLVAGDTVAGLRIKSIQRDRVIVVGLDTVWTLTVREPWR